MKPSWEEFARALIVRFGGPSKRQRARREAVLGEPFPRQWRHLLDTRWAHYRRLPTAYRERFEQQTQIFLAEKRITGIKLELAWEARLLVAASGVTLTAGWPDYTWDHLTEVLVYPQGFNRDYEFDEADRSGIAHLWGVVILSLPWLDRSFDEESGAYHVGLHEFAHLLDLAETRFDGIPSYLDDEAIRRWVRLLEVEEKRLEQGDSVLDEYALTGPEELFAVSVETFFQTPVIMAQHHPDLYNFLSSYFHQDPASWSRPRA